MNDFPDRAAVEASLGDANWPAGRQWTRIVLEGLRAFKVPRGAAGALARTPQERFGDRVSVRDFGAVGDGRPRAVREWLKGGRLDRGYADLAALRRDFPHVEGADDEVDWAATQAAIDAVARAGGGTVHSPAGRYVCNRGLTFPRCSSFAGNRGVEVNWSGDGGRATLYSWRDDLGPGRFAVTVAGRTEPGAQSFGLWADIGLLGPWAGEPPKMGGWGWAARRRVVRCRATGFRVGLDIQGDHTALEECYVERCVYGFYWSRPNASLFGDLVMLKCQSRLNTKAAIGVHGDASVLGLTAIGCFFGTSPYAVWKERGANEDILADCAFINCMFEGCGNGWIAEAGEPKTGVVRDTVFQLCQHKWQPAYALQGEGRSALWHFKEARYVHLQLPKQAFLMTPGEDALFRLDHARGFKIVGEVDRLLDNCVAAGSAFFHPGLALMEDLVAVELEQPGAWSGHLVWSLERSHGGEGIEAGQVLEWHGTAVAPSSGGADRVPMGVCRFAAPAGDGQVRPIGVAATQGAAVRVITDQDVAGRAVRAAANGTVAVAGAGDRAIGYAWHAEGGRALVRLSGLS